jgi:hypothetical protein
MPILLAVDEERRKWLLVAAAPHRNHLDWHPVLFSDKLDESVVCQIYFAGAQRHFPAANTYKINGGDSDK